jgi:hypothetical protein
MNGIGKLVKEGMTIIGEFFADHLTRQMDPNTENALYRDHEEVAKYIFSQL